MNEVQRLISTGLRDIHNWIKDEHIIQSVYENVWRADCEQNVYSKVTKGLWMKPCFSDFNNVEIKIRKSLEISTKLVTKTLCTFFFRPQNPWKHCSLYYIIKYFAWYSCSSRVSLKIWLFRQFCVQNFSGDTKLHELTLQRCKLCRLSCVMYWILKERFHKKI